MQICYFLQYLKMQYFLKFEKLPVILSLELQKCTRNGEEGYTAVPPEQSFENCQFDTALIEEGMY